MKQRSCEIEIACDVASAMNAWKGFERFHEWVPCFLRHKQIKGDFWELGSERRAFFLHGEEVYEQCTEVIACDLPRENVSILRFRVEGEAVFFAELKFCFGFEEVGAGRTRVWLCWEYLIKGSGGGEGDLGWVDFHRTDAASYERYLKALKGFVEAGLVSSFFLVFVLK